MSKKFNQQIAKDTAIISTENLVTTALAKVKLEIEEKGNSFDELMKKINLL